MKNSPDQYAKTIYALEQRFPGQWIKNSQIAEKLQVTPGTVSTIIKQMEKKGQVLYKSHQGCKLTEEGKRLALSVLRIHRILEMFLNQVLLYDWSEVHEEAERLEQVSSTKFISALDKLMENPRTDPHGDPIPNENLEIKTTELLQLNTLGPGIHFRIKRILDQSAEYLSYLKEHGLLLDSNWEFISMNRAAGMINIRSMEYDHPIELLINQKTVDISIEMAASILVEPI